MPDNLGKYREIVIAIINTDLAQNPKLADLPSPVTADHTRYPCDDCEDPSWIGPAQHKVLTANPERARAICYKCIITEPRYAAQLAQMIKGDMIAADSEADNKPRMRP